MRRVFALVLLAGVAACSAATPPTVQNAGNNGAVASQSAREGRRGKLVLRFKIPKKHRRIRIVRNGRPQYVSPATQSLSLSITGPTNVSESVGLTVSSGNCTSTLTSTFCTLTIPGLAVGTGYQISVATYDGPLVGSATSGNLLSQNQNVGFSIVAGQTNNIQLTLGGVATSLAITPLNHALQVDQRGYALYGNFATKFLVTPLDADGNPIVGPGAPAPTASLAPGAQAMITAVGSLNPNEFSITGSYSATDPRVASNTSLTISATPVPGSGGSTIAQTVPLNQYQPWVYITDTTTDTIRVFDEAGNPILPAGGAFTTPPSGCQSLGGLAYGDGQLYGFYSLDNGGTIEACIVTWPAAGGAYTTSVTSSNIATIGDIAPSGGAAFDPHNNQLYVTGGGTTHNAQSYDGNLTTNVVNAKVSTNGNFGIIYIAQTNQIVVGPAAVDQGIYVCDEALASCTNIASGLPGGGGIAYDPYTGYLAAAEDSFGLRLFSLTGTFEGPVGNIPSDLTVFGVAFDPYQADYLIGYHDSSGTDGITRFTEGNSQITGGFTAWPSSHFPGQIMVLP